MRGGASSRRSSGSTPPSLRTFDPRKWRHRRREGTKAIRTCSRPYLEAVSGWPPTTPGRREASVPCGTTLNAVRVEVGLDHTVTGLLLVTSRAFGSAEAHAG